VTIDSSSLEVDRARVYVKVRSLCGRSMIQQISDVIEQRRGGLLAYSHTSLEFANIKAMQHLVERVRECGQLLGREMKDNSVALHPLHPHRSVPNGGPGSNRNRQVDGTPFRGPDHLDYG
jgi:hypothetical protein